MLVYTVQTVLRYIFSVSNSWSSVQVKGDVPLGRSAASLVAVGNKLYLFGGLSHTSGWTDSLHVFDLGMYLFKFESLMHT